MMKTTLLIGATVAGLLAGTGSAQAAPLKTVYGWAKLSGNSALVLTPAKATIGEIGESGLLGWSLGRKTGKPIRIDYTEGLDFRQVNKKCGKRAAGYPYDTSSKRAYGKTKCYPIHLYQLLKKGRLAVRVTYDPAGPMAVRVYELVLP